MRGGSLHGWIYINGHPNSMISKTAIVSSNQSPSQWPANQKRPSGRPNRTRREGTTTEGGTTTTGTTEETTEEGTGRTEATMEGSRVTASTGSRMAASTGRITTTVVDIMEDIRTTERF